MYGYKVCVCTSEHIYLTSSLYIFTFSTYNRLHYIQTNIDKKKSNAYITQNLGKKMVMDFLHYLNEFVLVLLTIKKY